MKTLAFSANLALIATVVNATEEEKVSQDGENSTSYTIVDKQPVPLDVGDTTSLSVHVGFFPILERFELVAQDASVQDSTGDRPGNWWGGHQTRIVRTSDNQVYTAYLVTGSRYNTSSWKLMRRTDQGWMKITSGLAGREPVNILRTSSDRIKIVAWPNQAPYLTTVIPAQNHAKSELNVPGQWKGGSNGDWAYNAAGIGSNNDLCILQSESSLKPSALNWACVNAKNSNWSFQRTSTPYRYCYAYMIPSGNRLDMVATRDVTWPTLGYTKPPGAFDYVFNAIGAWGTSQKFSNPMSFRQVREESQTASFQNVKTRIEDVYVDTNSRTHILYNCEGACKPDGAGRRHAILVGTNKVLRDVKISVEGPCRLTQDTIGNFYTLCGVHKQNILRVYPGISQDGLDIGSPAEFNMGSHPFLGSGLAIAVPRAGVPLADYVDGVYPSGTGGNEWVYFRIRLR